VYLGFFNKHGWTYYRRKTNSTLCKHRFPCNTLTHSINEDLLNIKRKGDPEVSYPLSYVRYHWNPEPVCNKSHFVSLFYLYWYFFNLLNLFWHTDKNFCFYVDVNFWDFVRNDNSNKGTTARLNETRFGPKKKSSPIYLDTFWCTGWAWNCQIIFRCASIHGRAGFILFINMNQTLKDFLWILSIKDFFVHCVCS
jgi:hypothetical protein